MGALGMEIRITLTEWCAKTVADREGLCVGTERGLCVKSCIADREHLR